MDDRGKRSPSRWTIAALAAVLACGCRHNIDTHLDSPYPKARVVAIAPFMNQSGSQHVDPLAVSDLFFSELQKVKGFQVLPINRSLQAMVALNMQTLNSPQDVLKIAEFLGADIIFVGAVTAYNPYDPPELGLAIQLYAVPGAGPYSGEPGGVDPAALERSARPLPVDAAAGGDPTRPRAQVNEIYNGGHQIVQKQIREYADIRDGSDSPLEWRLYMKSMPLFVRFCSYQAIRQVLAQEKERVWMLAARAERQRPTQAEATTGP